MTTRKETQELAPREAKAEAARQARLSWGPRIKKARERAGLTQVDLAEAAGVAVGTVQNVESGKAAPQEAKLQAILEVLGLLRHHTERWSDEQWSVAEMAVALFDQVPVARQPEAAERMAQMLADFLVQETTAPAVQAVPDWRDYDTAARNGSKDD